MISEKEGLGKGDERDIKIMSESVVKKLRRYGDTLFIDPVDPKVIFLSLRKSPLQGPIEDVIIRRRYWYTYATHEHLEGLCPKEILEKLNGYMQKEEIRKRVKIDYTPEKESELIVTGNLAALAVMSYDYEFHATLFLYEKWRKSGKKKVINKLAKQITNKVKSVSEGSSNVCDPALLFWALKLFIEDSGIFNEMVKNVPELFNNFIDKYITTGNYVEFKPERGDALRFIEVTPEMLTNMRSTLYMLLDLLEIVKNLNANTDSKKRMIRDIKKIIQSSRGWIKSNKGEIEKKPFLSALFLRCLALYYEVEHDYPIGPHINAILEDTYQKRKTRKGRVKVILRRVLFKILDFFT